MLAFVTKDGIYYPFSDNPVPKVQFTGTTSRPAIFHVPIRIYDLPRRQVFHGAPAEARQKRMKGEEWCG